MRKIKTYWVVLVVLLIIGCNVKQQQLSKIQDLDQKSRNSKTVQEWNIHAEALVNELTDYAQSYPNDSISPSLLFKASEIYLLTGDTNKALTTLQELITTMPYIEQLPKVLFREAYIYDLKDDRATALKKYTAIIKTYPDDFMALKAQEAIREINFFNDTLNKDTNLFSPENE
jgi:tetratricopeptide (TPR) repeat protein